MRRPLTFFDRYPGMPFYLVAAIIILSASSQTVFNINATWIETGESILPLILGSTLFYAGYRISREDLSGTASLRILAVTLGFGVVAILSVSLVISIRLLAGNPLGGESYILFLAMTAGLATGAPMSYYYHALQARKEDLQLQYEKIQTLNKRLSVSQRVLRHNLRNELTIIQGLTQEVISNPNRDDRQELLEEVYAHQIDLENLAEKSRLLRSVWETTETTETDVSSIVRQRVDEFQQTAQDVTVTTDIADIQPIPAHPRLDSAIEEALQNTIEHNETANLAVHVVVRSSDGPREDVHIEISDTGTGVPKTEREVLVQAEETSLVHGQGLGFWFIQSTLEQSGGHLTIEENDPHGTVVVMTLTR